MATYAGYIRVSSRNGREGERFRSPSQQDEAIRAWGARHGHEIIMLESEIDRKGDDRERPVMRQAVDGVRDGHYAGVAIAYLSRAGRDLRLMLDLFDEVEAAGGRIGSAAENLEGRSPSERMVRNILASIADGELAERREGFDRARAGAVESGIWPQPITPLGYRRGKDRRLHSDQRGAKVTAAFRDFASGGITIVDLAAKLGITGAGVRAMLRNRVYLGELRIAGYVNETAHEPLIDQGTFERVGRLLNGRQRIPSKRPPALLAGLARCVSCGYVITRHGGSRGEVYRCRGHRSGGRCPQPVAIDLDRLDAHVERIARDEIGRLRIEASEAPGAERAQAALERAEGELDAWIERVSAAELGEGILERGLIVRQGVVEETRKTLMEELARRSAFPVISSAAGAWERMSPHERNALLRGLLAAVIVRPVGRGRRVPVDERVRVLRRGAQLGLPEVAASTGWGPQPLPWPDADSVDVLGIPAGEDALEYPGGGNEMGGRVTHA